MADSQSIHWNPDASFNLDVAEFEESISVAKVNKEKKYTHEYEGTLERAVELYRGKLLEDCYDEWINPIRDTLHREYLWALKELIKLHENKRDYAQAINHTEKLISEDPFDEKSYRMLMRFHALNEDRAKAILAYRECERVLKRELNIAPGFRTTFLYKQITDINNAERPPDLKYLSSKKPDSERKLIGRNAEWEVLLNSWKKTLNGTMRMFLIRGDPGIGKTRLALELLNYVTRQGYATAYAKSYEAGASLSYGPIVSWLRSEAIHKQLKNLDQVLLSELLRLIPELTEQNPELSRPEPLQESWQQNRFYRAIAKALAGNSSPSLFVLDDLQWCDDETLNWLNYLFHSEIGSRILIVGLMRPVEVTANKELNLLMTNLLRQGCITEVSLGKLTLDETIELASTEADQELAVEMGRQLYQETEGNPLFIIETIRDRYHEHFSKPVKVSSQKEFLTSYSVPKKIAEVINARFQKVSKEALELAGLAATIGREFSPDVLSRVNKVNKKTLISLLEELQQHNIIHEIEANIFDFTHDKLREVAYLNLSKTRKQWLHQEIAQALEDLNAKNLSGKCGTLAFHYKNAGNIEKAIKYYRMAAQDERDILSKLDIIYNQNALALLRKVPEREERDHMEYNILCELAVSLIHTKAHDINYITRLTERIQELSKKLNRTPSALELFAVSMGSLLKGNLENFYTAANKMFDLAVKAKDEIAKVEACYMLGGAELYFKGNTSEAIRYYRQGLELYSPEQHKAHMRLYDLDGGIVLQAGMVSYLLMTCRQVEAMKLLKKTFRTAHSSTNPFNVMYVNFMLAWWRMLLNKPAKALVAIEKFRSFKTEYELFHWNIHSKVILGWSLAHRNRPHTGISLMQEGIDELKAHTFIPDLPHYYGMLAELLGKHNNLQEACLLIDRALELIDHTGVCFAEAEIYRIRGNLQLIEDPANREEAFCSFQHALKVARQQGINIFEHRAKWCLEQLEK